MTVTKTIVFIFDPNEEAEAIGEFWKNTTGGTAKGGNSVWRLRRQGRDGKGRWCGFLNRLGMTGRGNGFLAPLEMTGAGACGRQESGAALGFLPRRRTADMTNGRWRA